MFFFWVPGGKLLDLVSLGVFGFAVTGTVVFLGGLTAVDLCPRRVTGAVMGLIGLFSYMGAALQDWASGYLINQGKTLVDGKVVLHFDQVIYFWVGASVLSLLLACSVWKVKPRDI